MAESVVTYLLEKLGDVVVQEALRLHGVGKQVEKVSRDLRRMQAFLQDADSSRNLDARQKQLVMEVRDLAYSIEDVIDTYLLQQPMKKPGKREAIMRVFMKTKKIPALHKLADEIDAIQARIKEISESKITYGTNNLGEGTSTEGESKPPTKPLVPLNYDDPDVVGFEDDRQNIVRLLLDQSSSRRRSVVSIVGAGGLGKTTLARKVFNSKEVKSGFEHRIWVTVSQKFELMDILRKIAEQVKMEPPKDLSEHHLTDLYELLTKKKYLLVLDDIWTNDLWTCIKGVLPHANNGSKILITTRILLVAKFAESEPYKLKFLTVESSLKLLLKKALPYHDADKGYPSDLHNLAEQFSKKCKGLPLALVVLGGLLLSKSPANHATWSKVMQTMHWGTDGKECLTILCTSYDDLPFALKSCFMYFAAFPEDYEIHVRSLLRMWIAEGFIPQQEKKTLEDTAESFFKDLVQRSMVQVSERLSSGYIETCRVHDLLRDLAVQKAKDDNFLMLCSTRNDVQSRSLTRRLAIHCNYDDPAVKINVSVKSTTLSLRSLLGFIPIPNFPQHRLLKVLRIVTNDSVMVSEFEKSNSLGQLRYCELRHNINFSDKYTFEKFIGGMKFIQTLHLQGVFFDLPDCVWYVKTLRHVLLSKGSSVGPPPLVDLPNLQTLLGVTGRKSWEEEGLPKLTNVKEMAIGLNEFKWDTITRFLSTLEHVTFLSITSDDFPLKLINMRGFSFHQNLQSLYLGGTCSFPDKPIALDFGMFPLHLSVLGLKLNLEQDPMPVLEKLENLHVLGLNGPCKIKEMCCLAGGFGQLKQLSIWELEEVVDWKIEKGAMPLLQELQVLACSQLRVPHGLQYLTVLEEITWPLKTGDPRESQISSLCKHVPTIKTSWL